MAASPSTSTLLDHLHAARRRFGVEPAREKLALVGQLAHRTITSAAHMRRFHDDLLYLLAFPDDAEVHATAGRLLGGFAERVRTLKQHRRATLDDTGIPGTASRHVFVYGIARWLADRHPADVALDLRGLADPGAFDALLTQFMTPVEADAVDADALAPRAWLRAATGARSTATWLVRQVEQLVATDRGPAEYDAAAVSLRWAHVRRSAGSIHRALPRHPVVFRNAMRATPRNPVGEVGRPLPGIVLLDRHEAEEVIDAARGALAARCREVHAISYANPREVWLADLGAGARLAVIGVAPVLRMGLEANYGYVLFSNGVPIGYGGISPLFFDANTGINLFDPFRGSEAGFLWTATLRAFRSLFRTRRFIVNAYQFGADNDEALDSGAFWFYYRLGFRPALPAVRRLASGEFRRLQADPSYRSDRRTLIALASGDLHLEMPDHRPDMAFEESWLGSLAMAVTRVLADAATNRRPAQHLVADAVAQALGARRRSRWPVPERRAFESLAPLVALAPDLDRWSPAQRRSLLAMMRAKAADQERDYVLLMQQQRRFIGSLRAATGHPV